jgi:hypothetical protein
MKVQHHLKLFPDGASHTSGTFCPYLLSIDCPADDGILHLCTQVQEDHKHCKCRQLSVQQPQSND